MKTRSIKLRLSILDTMASHRADHEAAARKQDTMSNMQQQDSLNSPSRDAQARGVAEPQIIVGNFDNDVDVEAGRCVTGVDKEVKDVLTDV